MNYCGAPNPDIRSLANCVLAAGHQGRHRSMAGERWDDMSPPSDVSEHREMGSDEPDAGL